MNTPDERLDLLLARANTGDPVLNEGLPKDALTFAPKPKRAVRGDDSPRRLRHDADANDLPAQRWGLVVPLGHEGDRMLEALAPLIRKTKLSRPNICAAKCFAGRNLVFLGLFWRGNSGIERSSDVARTA